MPGRASLTPVGELTCGGWSSGPVAVAAGFTQRLRGLRPAPSGCGLLLRTRSVHSFGMKVGLLVIGIDRDDKVIAVRHLPPRRVVTIRSARRLLELPIDASPPPVGAVLTWHGGGTIDSVLDSHRQSG